MNERHDEDVLLMGRVASGDHRAFELLFDRHGSLVLGLLTRMLGERSLAEEVFQEVFLQVWREASRYRPSLCSPRGWMVMLARSRALDRIRSDRARARREDAVAADPPPAAAGQADGIEAGDRSRHVAAALGRLPEEQRRCIELAFFDGLTHTQIAERLGAPLGTVKSRILMGMQKLRGAARDLDGLRP